MQTLLSLQQTYFKTQTTKSYEFRIEALKRLKRSIQKHETEILEALYKDLGKNEMEAYSTEVGYVLHSINFMMKRLKKWMRVKKVKTPLYMLNTKSYILHEPLGSVLIIGPYNYPFQLVVEPLIGAISAGNTAIVKVSEFAPHTENILEIILGEAFEKSYVALVKGDYLVNQQLVSMKFDHIFFTGSTHVGKLIYQEAAKNLVPVTLELGGKSPTIVCKDSDIQEAATRIAFGKFTNAGQTCIAPDYIYVDKHIEQPFVEALKMAIQKMYPNEADFTNVIPRHVKRVSSLIDKEKVTFQPHFESKIAPTIIQNVTWQDDVMQEEIFGPILPILTFDHIDEVIEVLISKEKPLALYLFTKDKALQKRILKTLSFGGGAINDTLMHVANPYLPFGGIGFSGIGHYHGYYSFELFSKKKGYIKKGKWDLGIQYPPYSSFKKRLIKFFLK